MEQMDTQREAEEKKREQLEEYIKTLQQERLQKQKDYEKFLFDKKNDPNKELITMLAAKAKQELIKKKIVRFPKIVKIAKLVKIAKNAKIAKIAKIANSDWRKTTYSNN